MIYLYSYSICTYYLNSGFKQRRELMPMDRKTFIKSVSIAAVSTQFTTASMPHINNVKSKNEKQSFKIQKIDNRYFLSSPEGEKFFSIGINHVDSATLRYSENEWIWKEKYANSMEKWLKESVRKNLLGWGFNTMGWNEEVVTRQAPDNHRHSRNFTPKEYRWLNMPYCHMLPFADFHNYDVETRHPDFFSKGFEEWCDYVARDEASRLSDDHNLIGYFYVDCPTWLHTRPESSWKGPLFDPEMLKSRAGRKELFRIATKYYKTTHDAVRRYDKNHLILGDRYNANRPLTDEIVNAAKPFVDVLSFQHMASPEEIVQNLDYWHSKTGMPTLVADSHNAVRDANTDYRNHTTENYEKVYNLLKKTNSCIGYHLCGAYIENRTRRLGLMDENENPHTEIVKVIQRVNTDMDQWVKSFNSN